MQESQNILDAQWVSTEADRHLRSADEWRFHVQWATVLLVMAAVVGAIPAVDLSVSAFFCHDGRWLWAEASVWRLLHRYGWMPVAGLAAAATMAWMATFVWRRLAAYRRACAIIALTVLLGPGLLVNVLIKPYWGRPRPLHVIEFGGDLPYRGWWQPSMHLTTDRGFASGDAATGFALLAIALVIPTRWRRTRRWVMAGALAYGILLSVARLAQGGHFFSDVIIGAGLSYWVAAMLLMVPFEAIWSWIRQLYARLRGQPQHPRLTSAPTVLAPPATSADTSSPAS